MKEKVFFFAKNVSRPSNPPDELAQNVSKKNPFRTNYSSIFSAKVQNLAVFSFIYMIRIRFFGPQELIQNGFRALPSVCGFKTSPCVRSKRPRVYRHEQDKRRDRIKKKREDEREKKRYDEKEERI